MLNWAATADGKGTGSVAGARGRGERKGILIADVSRAFFEAPARRDVCVELPEEALVDGESTAEVVGKLMASLYGTRDALANWQEEVNKSMRQWGLRWEDITLARTSTKKEAYVALSMGTILSVLEVSRT